MADPSSSSSARCVLDDQLVNEDSISEMADVGLSFFASLCGRNRGVFVLEGTNSSYGCLDFPKEFAERAGVNVTLEDANAVVRQWHAKNMSDAQAVDVLNQFSEAVYDSSANTEANMFGCDVSGLAKLEECPFEASGDRLVRAVTLAGAFVPEPWTQDMRAADYTAKDFEAMVLLGINTVQIPVPADMFEAGAAAAAADDDNNDDDTGLGDLSGLLDLVETSGLEAILALVGSATKEGVVAAARYASGQDGVFGIILPSLDEDAVKAARLVDEKLGLFLPVTLGDLEDLPVNAADEYLFAAIDLSHMSTVADVASSESQGDRTKMFYHESTSCINRSPIEYVQCYKNLPVFVSKGFDLAIDDCVLQGTPEFHNYGQCDRFDETIGSGWWHRHRLSYAKRQLFAYERGLGWSFAAWSAGGGVNSTAPVAGIDAPVKLLALESVAAAGLMPSLHNIVNSTSFAQEACLNAPVSDFVLGDQTLSPTPGPPPDCGNGWWNFDTKQCDYWVPPPPTPAPTSTPTPAPTPCVATTNKVAMLSSGGLGVAVGAVLAAVVFKMCGCSTRSGRGYSSVP